MLSKLFLYAYLTLILFFKLSTDSFFFVKSINYLITESYKSIIQRTSWFSICCFCYNKNEHFNSCKLFYHSSKIVKLTFFSLNSEPIVALDVIYMPFLLVIEGLLIFRLLQQNNELFSQHF